MKHVEEAISKSPESFIDHLLAMPEVGDGTDFDRARTGPRRIEL